MAADSRSLRIAHVITGLNVGGAERMLLGLAVAGPEAGFESQVICLGPRGPVSDLLEAEEVTVHHLGLASVWQFPFGLRQLGKMLRSASPDVVQGWMYHGNLAAYFAGRKLGVPIAWNIRQSLHRLDLFKATTRLTIRANARYSGRVDSVLYNSQVARQQHEAIGFSTTNGARIPNGVDLGRFTDGGRKRDAVRRQLGISEGEIAVIAVGRVHPIKGHNILLQSVRPVVDNNPAVRFVIVGRGADWDKQPFRMYQADETMRRKVILTGERGDVVDLLHAADVFVSASETEGFPNAVAEAMAAGLPCVVTDVGDCKFLVDDCGVVVSSGDPQQLATGLLQVSGLTADARQEIGARAQSRIENEFSLAEIARQYAGHYHRLVASPATAGS